MKAEDLNWNWKRPKPGHYNCNNKLGEWKMTSESATRWVLTTPDGKKKVRSSKRELKNTALDEAERIIKAREKKAAGKKPNSPESVEEGIRINAEGLLFEIIRLSKNIETLTEEIVNLRIDLRRKD